MTRSSVTAVALGAALLPACAGELPIERRSVGGPVATTIDVAEPPPAVAATLAAGLPPALAATPRFATLEVATSGEPPFPDPVQQRLAAGLDPALERYAGLPASAKALDLYLHDPLDRYWISTEYTASGEPTRFRSDFILHLEPAAAGGTRVEVFEYQPRIWPRDRFELAGHHGPGWYRDVRVVEPTREDRELLLAAVAAALEVPTP